MSNDLRNWIRLCETFGGMSDDDDEFPDEDAGKYDRLPASAAIKTHLNTICAEAQRVYDAWDQSDPDNDELNGGGVCHLIADRIADILCTAGMYVMTESSSWEQHVYCVGQFSDGVFEIDIPHRLYERGGGFTWYKLPNVRFEPDDVYIHRLDHDPANMGQYVTDWEED